MLIILRILCVDPEDADDNDGTDSDGADDADNADGGRNLGWPETSAHHPLIGGRALQLAGVYHLMMLMLILTMLMLLLMLMSLIMLPPTRHLLEVGRCN